MSDHSRYWTSSVWTSPIGAALRLREMAATSPERGAVHIQHGLAEHSGRYERVARALSEQGFHVLVHDHRGHGETYKPDDGPRSFGKGDGWDNVIRDALAVRAELKARHPSLPLISLGHSMGAAIAFEGALRDSAELDALILLAPPLKRTPATIAAARALLSIEAVIAGADRPSWVFATQVFGKYNVPFKPARTAFDWLSRDAAEVDAYVADAHCGWDAPNSIAAALCQGLAATFDNNRLKAVPAQLPVLIAGGTDDPVCDNGHAVTQLAVRLRAAGVMPVEDIVIPDARHELHNETDGPERRAAIADWARRAIEAAPTKGRAR